jgi:hypothetical protein
MGLDMGFGGGLAVGGAVDFSEPLGGGLPGVGSQEHPPLGWTNTVPTSAFSMASTLIERRYKRKTRETEPAEAIPPRPLLRITLPIINRQSVGCGADTEDWPGYGTGTIFQPAAVKPAVAAAENFPVWTSTLGAVPRSSRWAKAATCSVHVT